MTEKKHSVLIIEDNMQYIHALKNILQKNGYLTTTSTTGIEGLHKAKKVLPDLILLDVMLPDLEGYAVCERLKEDSNTRDIPVIFITIRTEVDDIVRGFDSGAVDYISKPFNAAELLARVRTHIELKRAKEEIKTLRGIVPICANCKRIRNDSGFWEQVEIYIESHTDAMFSHSICPECVKELYPHM